MNHVCLLALFGSKLGLLELDDRPAASLRKVAATVRGHIDGIDAVSVAGALRVIAEREITTVFIDGSNLGELARAVKRAVPAVRVVVFFHNVEARFFLGSLRERFSARKLAVLLANYLAERKAVRFSDIRIALSARDSALLRRLYGREATHLSPIALKDTRPAGTSDSSGPAKGEGYLLFVGGSFYANRAGILWFASHVAPRITLRTLVVGNGMGDLQAELEQGGMIEVIGSVDHVAPWYQGARLVVAPIFDGSGMKTKVAEAFMYGKRVIGTPEAFSGYDDIPPEWVCETADAFVMAINSAAASKIPQFSQELRRRYEATYSEAAIHARLGEILGVSVGAGQAAKR